MPGDMNKQSSSSAIKKEAKAILKKTHQQQSRRAPLPDFTTRNSNTSNGFSSSSSSSSSYSASFEAPTGCLRFFLTHSSSSHPNSPKNAPCKTPKSAPISRSKPRLLINTKNSFLKRNAKPQSRLKPEHKSSDSSPLNVNNQLKETDSVSTPATAVKLAVGSKNELADDGKLIGNRRDSKTPPIQSSLSPEIQCGSNIRTATPACYAAGHVLSGITDKRKCRPRGILTIGDDNYLPNSFDASLQVVGNVENSGVSMFPTPVEASMSWLLSPCREDPRGGKENSSGFEGRKPLNSPSSPRSALASSLDMCNIGSNSTSTPDTTSTKRHRRRKSSYFLSPSELSEIQECLDPPVGKIPFSHSPQIKPMGKDGQLSDNTGNVCRVHSPSSADSLASENVMQTPESCSSLERCSGYRMYHFDSELQSIREAVGRPSSSPNSHLSASDPASSSFRFDSMVTSSKSIDLSHFQKVLDDRSLYLSNSTSSSSQNISDSHMRISWREGLISRIFELDEFDSCRCVSDEEEELSICASEPHKSCRTSATNIDFVNEPGITNALKSAELLDAHLVTEGKEKQVLYAAPCSCAESISTDGGSLLCSDDSDWRLCYQNNLFEL